jgi:hypothetical protein
MQKIFIDYVGKLPRSKAGNTAILVCADAFPKFVWLVPVKEATTRTIIKALNGSIFCNFSVPEVLVSDKAPCFTSREFRQFFFGLGIKHVTISPYYPQPSHAEGFNKNLRSALIAYHSKSHTTWEQNLTWLQLAFNMGEHEVTRAAPFSVIFPFRSDSPLLNRWKINDLLPVKLNKRIVKQRWATVKQNLLKIHAYMAKSITEIGPLLYSR